MIGHVARLGKIRKANKILIGKSEGKISLGGLKHRCKRSLI
jgi:hypothetical protein